MSSVFAKRSSMTFFSDGCSQYSHRVRIVLADKGVTVEVLDVDPSNIPEDVASLNPYHSLPTLVDRDLTLYQSNVMMEYLDERFPHPPLLPVYPVARAQSRLWMYRIQRDWCGHVDVICNGASSREEVEFARKSLRESLVAVAPIFGEKPFFMSDEFTLVDCCVAPILWRLRYMEVDLPEKQCKAMFKYMDTLFNRESFQASLSDQEREIVNRF
jgi:stringent starvation protein A